MMSFAESKTLQKSENNLFFHSDNATRINDPIIYF